MTQLIVGLGNPGKEYERTRHNAGFMVIDSMVGQLKLEDSQHNPSYELWMWNPKPQSKVLLVKPLTFMNKSGEAVAELVRFFKIADDDITVIHDDVDLSLGVVRLRPRGGSAGHNGVASIQDSLGHENFKRVRIGVGRPPEAVPTDAYVLARFAARDERDHVAKIIDQVGQIVVELASTKREFKDETVYIEM